MINYRHFLLLSVAFSLCGRVIVEVTIPRMTFYMKVTPTVEMDSIAVFLYGPAGLSKCREVEKDIYELGFGRMRGGHSVFLGKKSMCMTL